MCNIDKNLECVSTNKKHSNTKWYQRYASKAPCTSWQNWLVLNGCAQFWPISNSCSPDLGPAIQGRGASGGYRDDIKIYKVHLRYRVWKLTLSSLGFPLEENNKKLTLLKMMVIVFEKNWLTHKHIDITCISFFKWIKNELYGKLIYNVNFKGIEFLANLTSKLTTKGGIKKTEVYLLRISWWLQKRAKVHRARWCWVWRATLSSTWLFSSRGIKPEKIPNIFLSKTNHQHHILSHMENQQV